MADVAMFIESVLKNQFCLYVVIQSGVEILNVISYSINQYITLLRIIMNTISSINIQIFLSLIIVLLGETVGLWFLNEKMNIPPERLFAANWVLHLSILSFIVNLISVPYNAVIVAHEKMSGQVVQDTYAHKEKT